MTYRERKRSEEEVEERRKKKWEETEDRVRNNLGFNCDKPCKALGLDRVKEKDVWYLEGRRISDIEATRLNNQVEQYRKRSENEWEMIWDFLELVGQEVINRVLGRALTKAEFNTHRIDELALHEWYSEFIPEDEYVLLEKQSVPRKKEILIFLEVKDWKPDQTVNADEIDKFVGKMIRGDAGHGVFVARTFSKSIQDVVRGFNKELRKIGKSIEVVSLQELGIK